MSDPDLNLLPALDALLREGSVTGAARRLGLSASAMSRTLARLRQATGDPLLVRAGRGMVATPRALELRAQVQVLTHGARQVLSPQVAVLDPARLERAFSLRANAGFLDRFAPALVTALRAEAPGLQLRFQAKPLKSADPLRDGACDLEVGTPADPASEAPELRRKLLFRDHFLAAIRAGHPLRAHPGDAAAFAACDHVVAARRGGGRGPVDTALEQLGLARRIAVVVLGFPEALRIAAASDLVALVPASMMAGQGAALEALALPVETPPLSVWLMWHPRLQEDPGHRWLRGAVVRICHEMAAKTARPRG
ncbi:LysR family transcriptional regulator [Pseudooceanicola sp. CBS1P-1]|uniref:LysR family transcriptional regulator n=1 Tax=Pseudooceanicola albus TaxID=2692189 RepID=A0A6L7FZC0_9RHOB|nr:MULTISPECIES: LysR family transcriptional regulator [Pseudooceanicola]MBT9383589.1 LysR family transcriptional regulator [Pseudooceanicola endophyticus]MXN17444.1 LysR family transcriptional regulator [Pseudooceanicola albus]